MKLWVVITSVIGLGVAGLALALPSKSLTPKEIDRIRGKQAYYRGDVENDGIEITVRLADEKESVAFKTRIEFTYQAGLDQEDVQEIIQKRKPYAEDRLTLAFSDMTSDQLRTSGTRHHLRRMVARILDEALFPGGEARVREVLFPVFQFMVDLN